MAETMTGACLCGAVQYQLNQPVKAVANCHCNTCKKISGAAFQTVVIVDRDAFEITAGKETLSSYQMTENARKHFCRNCGSAVYVLHKKFPASCLLQLGSLSDPTAVQPTINVFCETMLPWVKDITALPSFDQRPEKGNA